MFSLPTLSLRRFLWQSRKPPTTASDSQTPAASATLAQNSPTTSTSRCKDYSLTPSFTSSPLYSAAFKHQTHIVG
ncbi:hypothetical protein K490DRAFT_66017 [Saccharata proteae CBS 121410]|uniref:Uncharacterized protein n=1 Tax=Saccharata proteae CBS 121410 TaxID=1314787 RepID=A0A9P4LX16_9PEZI|nr:hypothetical protein K490DRAFT_66017 [Saccharata proteae CBS 121410]